jgi:S1-C subfamily serine protease
MKCTPGQEITISKISCRSASGSARSRSAQRGAFVSQVMPNSSAAKAGIKAEMASLFLTGARWRLENVASVWQWVKQVANQQQQQEIAQTNRRKNYGSLSRSL